MSSRPPVVVKGKLQFKGGKTGPRKSQAVPSKPTAEVSATKPVPAGGLTEAQLKHKRAREELESRVAKKLVGSSYRERVEDFNG